MLALAILLTAVSPIWARACVGDLQITGIWPEDVKSELLEAHDRFIEARKKVTSTARGEAIPEVIQVGQREYNVQLYLGSGDEGDFYLVEWDGQLFAAKEFFKVTVLKENYQLAREVDAYGMRILTPLDADLSRRVILYPYIRGLAVDSILASASPRTREFVKTAYEVFLGTTTKFRDVNPNRSDVSSRNVLVDLNTFQFIILDPI